MRELAIVIVGALGIYALGVRLRHPHLTEMELLDCMIGGSCTPPWMDKKFEK